MLEPGRAHDVGLVQVAPVEDQRLLHAPVQHVEVGTAEFLPLGDDDEGVGAFARSERIGGERDARRIAEHDAPLRLLTAVEAVNEAQKHVLVDKIVARLGADLRGRRFALWGLAFKPNTDDMREAPSRTVIAALASRGARVTAYDPIAMNEAKRALGELAHVDYAASPQAACEGADGLVVVTEWKEFRSPDFDALKRLLKEPLVFDGRNLYEPDVVRAAGFEHVSIGRK